MGRARRSEEEKAFNRLLGLRCAIAREMAGLTQTQLGKSLRVTRAQVSMFETAGHSLTAWQIVKWAEACKIRVTRLISGRDR